MRISCPYAWQSAAHSVEIFPVPPRKRIFIQARPGDGLWRASSESLFRYLQHIFRRDRAVGSGAAKGIVIKIKFVTVMDEIRVFGNRHQTFPAIGHEWGRSHRIGIFANNDL